MSVGAVPSPGIHRRLTGDEVELKAALAEAREVAVRRGSIQLFAEDPGVTAEHIKPDQRDTSRIVEASLSLERTATVLKPLTAVLSSVSILKNCVLANQFVTALGGVLYLGYISLQFAVFFANESNTDQLNTAFERTCALVLGLSTWHLLGVLFFLPLLVVYGLRFLSPIASKVMVWCRQHLACLERCFCALFSKNPAQDTQRTPNAVVPEKLHTTSHVRVVEVNEMEDALFVVEQPDDTNIGAPTRVRARSRLVAPVMLLPPLVPEAHARPVEHTRQTHDDQKCESSQAPNHVSERSSQESTGETDEKASGMAMLPPASRASGVAPTETSSVSSGPAPPAVPAQQVQLAQPAQPAIQGQAAVGQLAQPTVPVGQVAQPTLHVGQLAQATAPVGQVGQFAQAAAPIGQFAQAAAPAAGNAPLPPIAWAAMGYKKKKRYAAIMRRRRAIDRLQQQAATAHLVQQQLLQQQQQDQ